MRDGEPLWPAGGFGGRRNNAAVAAAAQKAANGGAQHFHFGQGIGNKIGDNINYNNTGTTFDRDGTTVALTLAFLGALAGYGRGLPKLFGGDSGPAILGMLTMSVICTVYVIACIRSFIAARSS